jgi:hypothetical protein
VTNYSRLALALFTPLTTPNRPFVPPCSTAKKKCTSGIRMKKKKQKKKKKESSLLFLLLCLILCQFVCQSL